MVVKNAFGINSAGQAINFFAPEPSLNEYLVIDLFCLKGILKNIFSIKKNSLSFFLKVIFRSNYCRSTSSLASFLNLSIFDVYKVFNRITVRSDFEIDSKKLKIILLLTTLK